MVSYIGDDVGGPHVALSVKHLPITANTIAEWIKEAEKTSITHFGLVVMEDGNVDVAPNPDKFRQKPFGESNAGYPPVIDTLIEDLRCLIPSNVDLVLAWDMCSEGDFWIAAHIKPA
jgi:hypothetical protein